MKLKPDNIIVSENQVYVIDFGSAQLGLPSASGRQICQLYQKTEQFSKQTSGMIVFGEAEDVFALGCTLFKMFTGKYFRGMKRSFIQLNQQFGITVAHLLFGMLQEDVQV